MNETTTSSRKKPGVAFWATVVVVVGLVVYPLSLGPVWWLQRRIVPDYSPRVHASIGWFYRPLWRVAETRGTPVHKALLRYAGRFVPNRGFELPDAWHGAD